MNRRQILGVGVVAAAAGAGWSWWRSRIEPTSGGTIVLKNTQPEGSAALTSIWDLRLPQPGDGELVLSSLRGRPLVVNFWATWCPPCVKEMPEIDRFSREQAARGDAGWRVVGVAIDRREAVQGFLKKTPVSYPIGLAGYDVTELGRRLGNDAGGLPFTVVFNAAGEPTYRRLGSTSHAELNGWVKAEAR